MRDVGRYRCLSKDHVTNPASSEARVCVAMAHRTFRFKVAGQRDRDEHLLRRPPKRHQT